MKTSHLNFDEATCYGPVIRATNKAGARALKANLKLTSTISNAEIEVFSELLDIQASTANDN